MNNMDWKRALMIGSFVAGALFYLKGHRPAAMAAAGIGLATLAAEHPEKFEELWERAPEYMEKGNRFMDMASQFIGNIAEQSNRVREMRSPRTGAANY